MLRKKEAYTNTIPLPPTISQQLAITILHSHGEIITLNPFVLSYHAIRAPRNAVADEYYSSWYEIFERVRFVPSTISFKGCFQDEPWGLRTHIYAPMGVDLRSTYRIINGDQRVGDDKPLADPGGLYLREEVDLECNLTLMALVRSQLRASSKVLVDRLIKKAELLDAGVLQATVGVDGKLRTYNPADRTASNLRASPVPSPVQQQRWSYQSMPHSPSNEYAQFVPGPPGSLPDPQHAARREGVPLHPPRFSAELPVHAASPAGAWRGSDSKHPLGGTSSPRPYQEYLAELPAENDRVSPR
ncbi:uncharacterized protein BP01DRAFT_361246 [Aspergillus saccharolyticus JOP 1030-1]|uniref:DUF7053 domain-containing protein n=1 Tax=Aspergillus saccharolyticus JOP 1030-1 TaxID=1450539 RepID=A0A318ZYK7_9EURO|nr:hypothetical protein BP01DRAFT_361246 [Aspergillus saccharolyticus JOP 1030-1]PYH40462.1 hypothetical protein BP01DRAFT_361246 [Aspergillus saccharolyticus JOP 1030-1]